MPPGPPAPRARPPRLSRRPLPAAGAAAAAPPAGSSRERTSPPKRLTAAGPQRCSRSLPAKRPPSRATLRRAHPFPGTSSSPRLARSAGERRCRPHSRGAPPAACGPSLWPRPLWRDAGRASCPGTARTPGPARGPFGSPSSGASQQGRSCYPDPPAPPRDPRSRGTASLGKTASIQLMHFHTQTHVVRAQPFT